MSNKATDFTYPASLMSNGSSVTGYITLKPHVSTNRNTIYVGYGQDNYTGSYTVNAVKYGAVTHGICIPASAFRKNNAYLVVEINTTDKNGKFVSGSYAHSIILQHPNYKNYLFNCSIPDRTYPGETCTIDILKPKDGIPNGVYCDVDILYHKNVGRVTIATKRVNGKFSFTVPDLAINSSLTVRITTRDANTGRVIGVLPQSIKIEKAKTVTTTSSNTSVKDVNKPQIILPDNYSLTISEGEVVKIKGDSENLNDYMVIYAKTPCDVAKAVESYTTVEGYYAASQTDLKNKLITNSDKNASYYVLKAFDADSTFMTQDKDNKKIFYIRTPGTNDYETINDFYALQWFKDVEPGDLLYIYAIQRGIKYTTVTTTTTVTTPGENSTVTITPGNWICRHCDLNNYAWWSHYSNWSPYCTVSMSNIRTFLSQYNSTTTLSASFTLTLDRTVSYPPTIFVSKRRARMYEASLADMYLTPTTSGSGSSFTYTIPISYLSNLVAQNYNSFVINTHWGNNPQTQAKFINKTIKLTARRQATSTSTSTSKTTSSISYSDGNYNCINKIPLSTMTPYVVIPPAVRPIELSVKENTKKQVTINYTNPLYNVKTDALVTYKDLGNIVFDVSKGDDINDLSNLNPVYDENNNEVQIDKTLYIDIGEKRLLTYEKSLPIPSDLLTSIKHSTSNDLYLDLNLKSIDGGNLNFKTITSNEAKVQIMFSNSGENKTRMIDYSGSVIDYRKPEYTIYKSRINKNLLIDNNFDTIHLLYNTDKYDMGKSYKVDNTLMQISSDKNSEAIGLSKINSTMFGKCTFTSETFEIAKYALNYTQYKLRLCLENMSADSNLFSPPVVTVTHRNLAPENDTPITETVLTPITQGAIKPGEDIFYDIPYDLYNVNIDDHLTYTLSMESPYPLNTPNITFSSAYIEVIGLFQMDQLVDKYTTGFTATATFSEPKKETATTNTSSVSSFDPVQCIDVIMCCFDSKKNLINKSATKRRDIYNGKEFIYYTDRKWHNLVNDKYKNHVKYKDSYDMKFTVPDNTEYLFFIAFAYSNWHDNPSIYSMSNILTVNSVQQDFSLEFIDPAPTIDEIDGTLYANSDINNPSITVKVNAQKNSSIAVTNNMSDNGFNLAKDKFDRNKWVSNPIIYSNTKQFGYELPVFNSSETYTLNNVVSSLEPLYNDIEYYSQWKALYGKAVVNSPGHIENVDPVEIDSKYTVYEDEGDKFISNRSIPYIELPAELASYDRSKITLFLDTSFGAEYIQKPTEIPTKLVTETFTINYTISKVRGRLWGVKDLWNKGLMNKLGDVAAIEDIKIEWGMKLNLDHRHPTQGRKGPILLEDIYHATGWYLYNPFIYFTWLKDKTIRDYGGNNIWHKNYGDYIYFEITNPRIKRLFLDCNCFCRRHDAILFEDYVYDWCWEKTVKVRFTVTKRVYEDGTPIYNQNLPEENFTSNYNPPGWDLFEKPRMKAANLRLTKAPTNSDPSFVFMYDVMISPLIYKHTNPKGDAFGNIYKYAWGINAECYRKWETITVRGTAPYTHSQTHYFITYNQAFNAQATFTFKINKNGTVTQE